MLTIMCVGGRFGCSPLGKYLTRQQNPFLIRKRPYSLKNPQLNSRKYVWRMMVINISLSLNLRIFNLIKLMMEINSSSLSRKIRSPLKVCGLKVNVDLLNRQRKPNSILWNSIFKVGKNVFDYDHIFVISIKFRV